MNDRTQNELMAIENELWYPLNKAEGAAETAAAGIRELQRREVLPNGDANIEALHERIETARKILSAAECDIRYALNQARQTKIKGLS